MSAIVEVGQNQVLERPSYYHLEEGFLSGIAWDRGENVNSALMFISRTEMYGETKVYVQLAIRVRGQDAHFVQDVLNWMENNKDEQGKKPPVLFSINCHTASYQRNTGEKSPCGQFDKKENIVYFNGKNPMMINAKTRQVLAQGRYFEMQEPA